MTLKKSHIKIFDMTLKKLHIKIFVGCDSFKCVPLLIYICDMTLLHICENPMTKNAQEVL